MSAVAAQSRAVGRAAPRCAAHATKTSSAGQESNAGHEERWYLRHAPIDRQVRRSPDDVDGSEGSDERDARGATHGVATNGTG